MATGWRCSAWPGTRQLKAEADEHGTPSDGGSPQPAESDPSPRINEQLANSHRIQGILHEADGDSELAEREWQEALRLLALNPDGAIGADHHLIAGEVHRRLGQTASAAEHARVLFGKGWRHPEWVATLGG